MAAARSLNMLINWLMMPPSGWVWIGFLLFVLVSLIQLYFYWWYFRRAAFFRPATKAGFDGPVSVVICARNEYHNLDKNLPFILNQDYPDFEVVVVDDGSDDESELLLQRLQADYPRLKVVRLNENVNFFKGKKLALSVGIKSAKHDSILLTDADCRPAGPHWITRMADNFDGKRQMVLGYGAYEERSGLLNLLIRFDTFFIALQYFGLALAGKPYMGVGRNMAYHRSLFYQAKGFTSHYKVMSGDDDLFVNQVATARNVAVEMHPHSHTVSTPKTSFRAWLRQKRRHMSTGRYYKGGHKRRLGIFHFSQLLFFPLLVLCLATGWNSLVGIVVSGLFLLRTATLLIIFSRFAARLGEKKIFPFSFILDLIHPFISFIFVFSSFSGTTRRWK
jgi:poly-beta-1,6-N-acetyl-D-glucosamine synthase